MAGNRDWMYKRFVPGGGLNKDFLNGLETFVHFATSQPRFMSGDNIKCPCTKCKNRPFQDVYVVRTHIGRYGFMKDYKIWSCHGESLLSASDSCSLDRDYEQNTHERMIMDVVGHEYNVNDTDEPPNPRARGRADARTSSSSSSSHTSDVDGDASAPSDDRRILISISGETLIPSDHISNKLKLIFEGSVHAQGTSWKFIPDDHKCHYFEEFKKHCTWDASYDGLIYSLWLKKAACRYSEWVHDIKKYGERPPFIPINVWPSWQKYWNSEKSKQISAQAHNNRMSESDGPGIGIITHKGGTRCAVEYAIDYAKQKRVPVNEVARDVFNVFHPPNEGVPNSKSARISGAVRRKGMEQSQLGYTNPDMNSIFLEVTHGKSQKNRVFGLGCTTTGSCRKSSELCSQVNGSLVQMRQQLKDEIKEELKEEFQQLKDEIKEELKLELRADMEAFCRQFIAKYRPPPSK